MKAFVIALALLAAAPALAQNAGLVYPVESQSQSRSGVAPAAADKKLGMALMSAVVAADGTLASGSGAVSATKLTAGVYNVAFERSVAGCSFSATSATANDNSGVQDNLVMALHLQTASNGIQIQTLNQDGGALRDGSFHLLVFCPK